MKRLTPDSPELKSADLVAENIERLRELFPEAFANEGKIDFDVLRQLLGDRVDDGEERYGLNWYGKRAARQLALTPSTGTLRPCPEESVDWDTTQNIFIEGDNLEVLKLLQKSYAGKVKLIYIDPPYNTGKDFVYPDNFQDSIKNYLEITGQVEGGQRITSNTEASGRFHTDWLNMMYPRLKLAQRLLRGDGAIAISVDDTEVAQTKAICSEIFGDDNFLACVVWEKVHTRKNSAKTFSTSHDYVVIFAQSKDEWDRILLPREGESAYRNPDGDPKGPWKSDPITAHNPYSADYKIKKPNGVVLSRPTGRYWAFSEDTWNRKVSAGEVLWGEGDSYPMIKRYLSEVQEGLVPVTLFTREFAGDTATAKKELDELFEQQGIFDYPKPTLLIRRLLQICVRSGEYVLDFFGGSGTTGDAVMRQNAADDSGRRFIAVQLPEPLVASDPEQATALQYCQQLGRPLNIAELTKERLRRAGVRTRSDPSGGSCDIGFRVYKLDSGNVQPWEASRDTLAEALKAAVDHVKPDRTEEDLLYDMILKHGLGLCAPIQEKQIGSHKVRSVGGGAVFACFGSRITAADVEQLADGIAKWRDDLAPANPELSRVVFRDSAFETDVAKTNLALILKERGFDEKLVVSL